MQERIETFVASAAEAFGLSGPVYHFNFCAGHFGFCAGADSVDPAMLRDCFGHTVRVGFPMDEASELPALPFPDSVARTVLCIGALEQAHQPQRLMSEIARILAPGGALLVCAPAEPSASEPAYWHLTPRSVQRLLEGMQSTLVGWQGAEAHPHTVYGVGFKRPAAGAILQAGTRFTTLFQHRLSRAAERIGTWQRWAELLTAWTRSRPERRRWRDYHKLHFMVHASVDRSRRLGLLQGCLKD